MLDYIKNRVALDFQFLTDYWWTFAILILFIAVVLILTRFKK